MQTSISIIWHINDVQSQATSTFNSTLSDEDASTVFKYLEDNYDASHGITWETIDDAIRELKDEINLIPLS